LEIRSERPKRENEKVWAARQGNEGKREKTKKKKVELSEGGPN